MPQKNLFWSPTVENEGGKGELHIPGSVFPDSFVGSNLGRRYVKSTNKESPNLQVEKSYCKKSYCKMSDCTKITK